MDSGTERLEAKSLLNPAQRRSLAIALRRLEMSLRETEIWLARSDEAGVLYQRVLALPDGQREAVAALVAAGIEDITSLAQEFELQRTAEDMGAHIAAEMSVHWADLADARSNKLRRYGAVDPRLQDVLDARLERLSQLALRLAHTFRGEWVE